MPVPPNMVHSDDEDEELEYMLGFVESPEKPTDLLRHKFPSKVGGAPAWLDPLHLPTAEQLTCGVTGEVMRFLLQVYCPVDVNPVDAFHRAVFLFVSPRGDQLTQPGAVRALRCQLRRSNPYYADTPAPDSQVVPTPLAACDAALSLERDPWKVLAAEQQIAAAAAAGGAAYDEALSAAAAVAAAAAAAAGGPAVFQEQELLVEPEPDEDEAGAAQPEMQRLLASYETRVAAEGEYGEEELPADLLDELELRPGAPQAVFAAFQARTACAPEQCVRYCFQAGAQPLWASAAHTPSPADIPACPHCGVERAFEFQVMPQLLSLMELDAEDPHAPDWGTIVVYSCPRSCTVPLGQAAQAGPSAYVEEFVWVQPS